MKNNYIDAQTFKEFCTNQESLINILNHRMTSIEKNVVSISVDSSWTKKLLWGILGVAITSLVTILIKTSFGI